MGAGGAGTIGDLEELEWLETLEEYKVRLKQVVADINAEHDVAGLCRELPDRVAKLGELEGGRLPK